MGKLTGWDNVLLKVRTNDHNPPHVHVVTPDDEALIDIKTLEVIAGSVPAKVLQEALRWIEESRQDVIAEWNRVNPNMPYRS